MSQLKIKTLKIKFLFYLEPKIDTPGNVDKRRLSVITLKLSHIVVSDEDRILPANFSILVFAKRVGTADD